MKLTQIPIMENKQLIGLSFSGCVADIAAGYIQLDSVLKILSATKCETYRDWVEVIDQYANSYWIGYCRDGTEEDEEEFIKKCIDIAYKCIELTEQPRLQNNNRYPRRDHATRWIDDESKIIWSC